MMSLLKGINENNEIPKVTEWDKMSLVMKYPSVSYNGSKYFGKNRSLSESDIGKFIDALYTTGYDEQNDVYHETEVSLYSIRGISVECAVAAKYESASRYYVYVNTEYNPKTLGEFIDDLNLQENLTFGSVYYYYYYGNGEHSTVEFVDLDGTVVWDMLFADRDVRNIYAEGRDYDEDVSVTVNLSILGYDNNSLRITENGYVVTNILEK